MTAVLDENTAASVHLGANVLITRRNGCKRTVNVQLGKERRRCLNTRAACGNRRSDLLEKLVFQGAELVRRTENSRFLVLQILRDISLAIYERLLSYVVVGDHGKKRLRNLNIVSENLVVANLQGLDTRGFLLVRLDLLYPALAVISNSAELIHVGVIAVCNHAAVADGKRRIVNDRRVNKRTYVLKLVKLAVNAMKLSALTGSKLSLNFGDNPRRICHRAQILCGSGAVNDTGNKSFKVENRRKQLGKLLSQNEIVVKLADGTLSLNYTADTKQRVLYPLAKHSGARRSACLIKHPQQRALLLL